MLKLRNTLSRKKEVFKPLKEKTVNLFVCGPTVYDHAHLGHAKSYIQFDVIARFLRHQGYQVFYLQNITDIDDKIIKRAQETKRSPKEVAEAFTKSYLEDMQSLNATSVNRYAPATNYMPEIVSQIQRMLKQGLAYELSDGVYFNISKFKGYGKLSHQDLKQLNQHRIEPNQKKKNAGDFSLWKSAKPGEPFWDSPFGQGRPGWHIEDTAITEKEFGQQYDIHGGGIDLIFPHHEAEICQMESLSGKPLVKYWLHNGFLQVNNEKMSKSLGNFITIKDALSRWGSMAVRFFFATNHYREQINFTEEAVLSAKNGYERLNNLHFNLTEKIKTAKDGKKSSKLLKKVSLHYQQFIKEMEKDFNTPAAAAHLFELARELNSYLNDSPEKKTLQEGLTSLQELAGILGLQFTQAEAIPAKIRELTKQRETARKNKDWAQSDTLRKEIEAAGYSIDDTIEGTRIRKKK